MKQTLQLLMLSACLGLTCACSNDDLQDGAKSLTEKCAPTASLTVTLYGKTYKNVPTGYTEQGDFRGSYTNENNSKI